MSQGKYSEPSVVDKLVRGAVVLYHRADAFFNVRDFDESDALASIVAADIRSQTRGVSFWEAYNQICEDHPVCDNAGGSVADYAEQCEAERFREDPAYDITTIDGPVMDDSLLMKRQLKISRTFRELSFEPGIEGRTFYGGTLDIGKAVQRSCPDLGSKISPYEMGCYNSVRFKVQELPFKSDLKEKWNKLTPEQREDIVEKLRIKFGGKTGGNAA